MGDVKQYILSTVNRLKNYRLTLLAALTLFVFMIVSITIFIALVIFFVLLRMELFSITDSSKLLMIITILLLSSVVISIVLTLILGRHPLHPLGVLTEATKEIAQGNFDVEIPVVGTIELKHLAKSFNAIARELYSIESLSNDFVSNVSHELKTPVNAIKGFARFLEKENLSDEVRREYVEIIIGEAERLGKLSGNVLLLSKLENTEALRNTAFTTFSLDEQIRLAVLDLEAKWREKSLVLHINLAETNYTGNKELLYHLWYNLVDNAVKFSPEEGNVWISLTKYQGTLLFQIMDQGPGIGVEDKHRIYDKFYQSDKSHATDGNGLGLALAKKIVLLCGGTIELGEEEGGASFQVILPIGS